MAYRRRKKSAPGIVADTLKRTATGFRRLSGVSKAIVICVPCLIIGALLLILILPHNAPVYEASTSAVPTEVSAPTATPIPTTTIPEATEAPPLKKGDEGKDVQELQQRLMDLGYLDTDEATEHFGGATETAVKWFQRQMGLDQTGIADATTQEWLNSGDAKHYTLLEKTSGSDVTGLQEQLKRLGYLSKKTGYYGSETVEAVKKFQKRNNLTADGKTGEQTLELIYSPKAKPDPSVAAARRSKANVDKMIKAAQGKIGKPYVSGAEGPNSFDCSGFVYWCLKQAGSDRGRFNAAGYSQVDDWKKITSMGALRRGDLIFFWDSGKGKIGHVAIYIGNGMMIDASSSNGKVVKRASTSSWCKREFRLGRRPW